jgi:uncharacterized protein (TIGR02996 family)
VRAAGDDAGVPDDVRRAVTVDEEALVAAIRADPDGDGPRIAYADWLGERGDRLGEWIALRMQDERLAPDDPARKPLWARLDALGFGERWHRAFDQYVSTERGMVSALALAPDQLRDDLLPHLRGTMVRDLSLGHGHVDADGMAALARALARMAVRKLRLAAYLTLAQRTRLWPLLPGLESLAMWETALADDDGRALADAPLPRLRELHARYVSHPVRTDGLFGDAGAIALAGSTRLVALRDVTLRCWRITARGAAALLDGALPLDALDVSGNAIGAAGVVDLVRKPAAARLRALGLAGVGLDDDAAVALAASPQLANLRRLVLSYESMASGLSMRGVTALAASPYLSPELEVVIDGAALDLTTSVGTDAMTGQVVMTSWQGSPPAAIAERFHVTVDGYAPEPT